MNRRKLELSDKIRQFLIEKNKKMLFSELSFDYLKEAHLEDVLTGVPVPITPDAMSNLSNHTIAMGMARVIGADPEFRYADAYRECLDRMFGNDGDKKLIREGAGAGEGGNFEIACTYFRAALQLNPDSRDALYLYGRACNDAYEQEGMDENYVGSFKAQAIDIFEELTIQYPDYDMGYYFLGYHYANLGLYTKAHLSWEKFMELSREYHADEGENLSPIPDDEMQEMREEIGDRLESLEEAVHIESAVNRIMAGDFQTGIEVLSQYESGPYSEWWPLWYYLGYAYAGMGQGEESAAAYRRALQLSPSNTQVMTELVEVYQSLGEYANAEKYINKIRVIQEGLETETQR